MREDWADGLYQGREILWDLEAEEGIHEEKVIWLFRSRPSSSLNASVAAHLSGPTQKIKEGREGAENISLIVEAVEEGGMLTCQSPLLHPWLPGDILLGDHQPRHLRPHGGQRNLGFKGDVSGRFDLIIGENEIRASFIDDSL